MSNEHVDAEGAPMISVRINGKTRAVAAGRSVRALMEALEVDPRGVVVEVNKTIVRRPELAAVTVREGDEIELVHFVGGG